MKSGKLLLLLLSFNVFYYAAVVLILHFSYVYINYSSFAFFYGLIILFDGYYIRIVHLRHALLPMMLNVVIQMIGKGTFFLAFPKLNMRYFF